MSQSPLADSSPPTARRSSPWPLVTIVAVFVLSRIGYYFASVRFDASPLPWFWQFIDPVLLKTNLAQSLWYLHSRPPAFNLFPGHATAAYATCYLLLGLAFAVAPFQLLRGLRVPVALKRNLRPFRLAGSWRMVRGLELPTWMMASSGSNAGYALLSTYPQACPANSR